MQIEIVVAIQKRARDVGSRAETTPITRPFGEEDSGVWTGGEIDFVTRGR